MDGLLCAQFQLIIKAMEARDLRLGNLVLRARSSDYKHWKETTVNLSHLELILQNPNYFKGIPPNSGATGEVRVNKGRRNTQSF